MVGVDFALPLTECDAMSRLPYRDCVVLVGAKRGNLCDGPLFIKSL